MEFRARYIMIGSFTVGIIAAVFLFVYWLNNAGSLAEQAIYKIRFQNTVTGLQSGSSVLFNGIRVGEVKSMQLDPKRPKDLMAVISIDKSTPIHTDTRIGIEFQGLTGGANILLAGENSNAPRLVSREGNIPVMVAHPSVGQSWTSAAGEVLKHIDGILTDNADPLKSMLGNFNKFSEVLAKNTDRIDGILSGLERMTGGGSKGKVPLYDLAVVEGMGKPETLPEWHVVISEPTVLLGLNTDKIMLQPKPGEILSIDNAKWTDNLPNLFQSKLVQSFENAGYTKSISKPAAGADGTHRLLIDIRQFHLASGDKPRAQTSFVAKIFDNDGKVIATRTFKAEAPAVSVDAAGASKALGDVFKITVKDLILWTLTSL